MLILIFILATSNISETLECFTGYSLVRGKLVGTNTKVCKKATDQCYKATIEGNALIKVKMAGCSSLRCKANKDKCITNNISGRQLEFCCCGTNRCNTKQKKDLASKFEGLIGRFFGGNKNFQHL